MPGVLHVCTGNLCRSPMAEVLLRAGLRSRFGPGPDLVPLTSAGTEARDGRSIWPLAADELTRRGLVATGFVSRRLVPAMVTDADLVLAATRAHRDAVLAETPTAMGRVFTWRELAWLLQGVPADAVPGAMPSERLQNLARVANSRRGLLQAPPPELLDVADPMGRDARHFVVAADEILVALRPVVDLL